MSQLINIAGLTPQERIELAEQLWDSLKEEDIELTPEQTHELEKRRDRLAREGPKGRPWDEIRKDSEPRGV